MNGKRTEIFPEICKSTAIFKRLRLCLLYQSTKQQNQTSISVEWNYEIVPL
jgi:hypothetical protein